MRLPYTTFKVPHVDDRILCADVAAQSCLSFAVLMLAPSCICVREATNRSQERSAVIHSAKFEMTVPISDTSMNLQGESCRVHARDASQYPVRASQQPVRGASAPFGILRARADGIVAHTWPSASVVLA